MGLIKKSEHLNGLIVFEPRVFSDSRGFFMESYRECDLEDAGVQAKFVQENHSKSAKNVLRGMHFQFDPPMGKLLRVTRGAARVIEVDLRKNSPFLGQHFTIELNETNKYILWVPAGFANGFLSLADDTEMQYKCTAYWNPYTERSIKWSDPQLAINWGESEPIVSEKDSEGISLKTWLATKDSESFRY